MTMNAYLNLEPKNYKIVQLNKMNSNRNANVKICNKKNSTINNTFCL